jgi:predicted nucleic acid-binding protein
MPFGVVLDTCVLYPAYLRDTLLRLANAGLYRPLWSREILAELRMNLEDRIGEQRANDLVLRISHEFPDAMTEGYEPLVMAMRNHAKDRHVLAAAVRSDASAISTFNLDDFPSMATEPFGVDVMHPDDLLLDLLDLSPARCQTTLLRQVSGYREPSMGLFGLADALERCGCPRTADELKRRSASEV